MLLITYFWSHCSQFLRPTIRIFCRIFKVRRHVIGCINHDIVTGLCSKILEVFLLQDRVKRFRLTWRSKRGISDCEPLLYPQTRSPTFDRHVFVSLRSLAIQIIRSLIQINWVQIRGSESCSNFMKLLLCAS